MQETKKEVQSQKQPRQRRDSGRPAATARELQRATEASTAKLAELAKEVGEKLNRMAAEVVNAIRLAEAQEREDHAKVRAVLATISGGAIERLVRVSKEQEIKAYLRERGWRC